MTRGAPPRLGALSLLALGINGVVGVGIFFVPSTVAKLVGGVDGAWVYLLVGVLCLPIALVFSRLGSRFSEDGGPYLYAREAFGPWFGFAVGWLTYVSAVFSAASVVRGMADALVLPLGLSSAWGGAVAGLAVLLLWAAVAAGLRFSAWAWTGLTIAKLLPLGALLAVGAWVVWTKPGHVSVPGNAGLLTKDPFTVLRAGLVVLFALQGFEIVPVPAGHVQKLRHVAWITAMVPLVASVVYAGLHFVAASSVRELGSSGAPLVDAATAVGGAGFGRLLFWGTSVSAFGIALGMIAMTPRYLSALGGHNGLGVWLGVENKQGVPTRALTLTAVAVLLLVQQGNLERLFALSSVAVLGQYGASAAALIVLAAKRQRGFQRVDIVLGTAGLLLALTVAAGATWAEVWRAMVAVGLGLALRVVRQWRVTSKHQGCSGT